MSSKRCCFAGHSQIHNDSIKVLLNETISNLIEKENVTEFWVGNYGDFDCCASSAIRELKRTYPGITLELVLPYLTDQYKEEYYKNYDKILIANIPENTPWRYKIINANEFIISNSELR